MKVTVLGSGSSGGVPLIGNYWGECDPNNKKNTRMRVSVSVELKNGKTIIIDTSPDLRVQALNNNMKNIDAVLWTHAHADGMPDPTEGYFVGNGRFSGRTVPVLAQVDANGAGRIRAVPKCFVLLNPF